MSPYQANQQTRTTESREYGSRGVYRCLGRERTLRCVLPVSPAIAMACTERGTVSKSRANLPLQWCFKHPDRCGFVHTPHCNDVERSNNGPEKDDCYRAIWLTNHVCSPIWNILSKMLIRMSVSRSSRSRVLPMPHIFSMTILTLLGERSPASYGSRFLSAFPCSLLASPA